MERPEHEPADPDRDAREEELTELEGDAYERAQPDSQPTVSSDPEPDDDAANAG